MLSVERNEQVKMGLDVAFVVDLVQRAKLFPGEIKVCVVSVRINTQNVLITLNEKQKILEQSSRGNYHERSV